MSNSRLQGFRRLFNVSTLTFRLWNFTGTAMINLLLWAMILAYLSPLSYMFITSLKTNSQLADSLAPILPSKAMQFDYQGDTYDVYEVPTGDGVKQWALVNPFRKYSEFVDPAHPELGLIHWDGSWRSLHKAYTFSVTFDNFVTLWNNIDYPNHMRNSLIVVGLAELGVLCSSIAVAYGFARFRIPGGKFLFFLCIATIMIPDSITLVPSFVIYTRVLDWNGTFLPIIVPHFFGSAIYIFLLRQNFKTIPREMDEAAMLDGAGPLRTLISVILPQAVPVVVTVALLQFFNVWNEMRMSSLYLSSALDLRTMPFTAQAFVSYGFTAEMLQASALLLIIVPVVLLFVAQRFFMRDMIVTGIEK